jgi:hypothetical protein
VLTLPSVTLGSLKTRLGKEWVISYLTMWVIELNDNSNVKNKMSDPQIEFTAERIYESYSLKITDLTLFFRNIKEGVYGGFYETLSSEKIMEWLGQYYNLRCEYGEMNAQQNSSGFSVSKDKIDKSVIGEMFKGVGEEKVEHDHPKRGQGMRIKNMMYAKILQTPTKEIKEYIINNDVNSEFYDEKIYKEFEDELDRRLKTSQD